MDANWNHLAQLTGTGGLGGTGSAATAFGRGAVGKSACQAGNRSLPYS